LKLTRKSHRSNSSLADVFTAFLWSKIGDGMAGVLQNLRENDHGDRSRMTNGQWLRDLLGGCYIGCYISGYGLSISIIEFPWMGWVPYVDIWSQMFNNLYTNIYIYYTDRHMNAHIFSRRSSTLCRTQVLWKRWRFQLRIIWDAGCACSWGLGEPPKVRTCRDDDVGEPFCF
jgi:hypothetical protein